MIRLTLLAKASMLLTFLLAAHSLSAQNTETEFEIIQEAFGLDKKQVVADFMQLENEASTFWELYDAYEAERKKLGKQRIEVIMQYADSYPNISDEELLALYKRTKEVRRSFAKLQDDYFKKMSKVLGVSKAAQFWQLENYFNSMIQANIYSYLPFIGEE